jgi:cephalosporin hydroxylase
MTGADPYDKDAAHRMATDPRIAALASELFLKTCEHRYSYNFTWLGRPVIQYPQDLMALQEIVWRVKPEVIVETGIAHGGSTVFFASMLELLGGDGVVVAVDVDIRPHNRAAIEAHPMKRRIEMIEGSSIDPAIAREVARLAGGKRPVMVVLDSNHTHEHVLAELALYSPLVTQQSYLVVMDTVVDRMPPDAFVDRPWGPGDNPMTAVRAFLSQTDRFVVDRDIEEKLLLTVAPSGYLRCVKD